MYNTTLRPHGEYFASNQAVTTGSVGGNVQANNPMFLAPSQAGCAITVATPVAGSLTLPGGASLTLHVLGARTREGTPAMLGTACLANDSGAPLTLGPDSPLCEFIPGRVLAERPWVSVKIQASSALTGSVDIFPAIIGQPQPR